MNQELTQEYLTTVLNYDKNTGIFTWKRRDRSVFKSDRAMNAWNRKCLNKRAGNINTINYRTIRLLGSNHYEHRLVWLYVYGYLPKIEIDHIDCNRSNNSLSNLRTATSGENSQNLRTAPAHNKYTGLLGVSYNKLAGRFIAQIKLKGKNNHLGYFSNPQDAHEAYLTAKRQTHPFGTL